MLYPRELSLTCRVHGASMDSSEHGNHRSASTDATAAAQKLAGGAGQWRGLQ